MLKIKDMKNSQFFWYAPDRWKGEREVLRVWAAPTIVDGVWTLDATCAGDYAWSLTEKDEEFMFEAVKGDY